MTTHIQRSALLPYPAQFLYDLVNDVARYPEFLPWCSAAEVLESSPEHMRASVGVAKGGLMWFFSLDNPELLVKVLNGCSIDNRFWVYISAGTNVGVDLFVEDTHTGEVVEYHNADLTPFPTVQDVYGLSCG